MFFARRTEEIIRAMTMIVCIVFLREIVVFIMIVFIMFSEVKIRASGVGDETDKQDGISRICKKP